MENVTMLERWGSFIPVGRPKLHTLDFFLLKSRIIMGRNHPLNDFNFSSNAISSHHLVLRWDGNDVLIWNMGTNGTFLNGEAIEQWRTLRDGDEVAFGRDAEYRYVFRLFNRKQRNALEQLYDMHTVIGQGSYGTVKKALERTTGDFVAVKELRSNLNSQRRLRDVAAEVGSLKALNHANIVQLKNVFHENNRIQLVLEYVAGGTLHDYMNRSGVRGWVDEPFAQHVIYQLCDAVAYMHIQKGILHRDLKPDNILLTRDNPPVVKVTDFGLAKAVNSERDFAETTVGTLQYFAPEMCQGGGYTNLIDSWGIGAILFEMLVGERLLEGKLNDLIVLKFYCETYTQKILDLFDAVFIPTSAHLKSFLRSLLQPNPLHRLPTATAHAHAWLAPYNASTVYVFDSDRNATKLRELLPRVGDNPCVLRYPRSILAGIPLEGLFFAVHKAALRSGTAPGGTPGVPMPIPDDLQSIVVSEDDDEDGGSTSASGSQTQSGSEQQGGTAPGAFGQVPSSVDAEASIDSTYFISVGSEAHDASRTFSV